MEEIDRAMLEKTRNAILTAKNLIDNKVPDGQDIDALSSIYSYYYRNNKLTEKQISYINSIADKYSPTTQEFKDSFTEEMRTKLRLVVKYYKYTGYFSEIVRKFESNPDFIPSRRQYERMCNNPYAVRALENYNSKPRYGLGDMVCIRQSLHHRAKDDELPIGMIVEVDDEPSFAKGDRKYKLIWITGEYYTDTLREMDIKIHREPKPKKINASTNKI